MLRATGLPASQIAVRFDIVSDVHVELHSSDLSRHHPYQPAGLMLLLSTTHCLGRPRWLLHTS